MADSNNSKSRRQNGKAKAKGQRPRACVGVGGSAGSLQAFQRLLDSVKPNSGLAYILLPHLAPDHHSLLPELLAKRTEMPVKTVNRALRARANHVYVIAANKDLTIRDGVLRPCPRTDVHGVRTTIYRFLSDLAADQGRRAVGIIVSGTGNDGSEGIKEIKAHGGLTLVQTPETADYDGMPRSAINTGMADRVLSIEDMPGELQRFLDHPYVRGKGPTPDEADEADDPDAGGMNEILKLLERRQGQDFQHYKRGTLARRIDRRMGIREVTQRADYLALLHDDADEVEQLYQDLLIGVTQFFREPKAFEALEEHCLGPLVERVAGTDEAIRVWVPGCATGEEAFSIGIGLLEAAQRQGGNTPRMQIFATDIDERALARARNGLYPDSIAEHVPAARLERWFTKSADGYQIDKALRDSVVLAPQNLITDPPFSRLDLISCRNLLIYLSKGVQPRLVSMFHFALRAGGHLFLGNSESIDNSAGLFTPIHRKWRLYRRNEQTAEHDAPGGHAGWAGPPRPDLRRSPLPRAEGEDAEQSLARATQRALLQEFTPASVLVDDNFTIAQMHGDLGPYLAFPAGAPTDNLLNLARRGLRGRIREAVAAVTADSPPHLRLDARVLRDDRRYHSVQLLARALRPPGRKHTYALLSLRDAPTAGQNDAAGPPDDPGLVAQLEYELKTSQDELQGTIEELEAANEELKTSNEEALSINEELQSSNEELESSKEELQSLNEELNTLNAELQEKIDQVESANTDLVNLLGSTGIATVFLDQQYRIKRYTPEARRLFNLIDSDVGRPISDISHHFQVDFDIAADAHKVQRSGQTLESEELTNSNDWYLRRVTPYRRSDGRIDGVVLAFLNVTRLKHTEARLEHSEARFRALFNDNPSMYVSLDAHGYINSINDFGAAQLGYTVDELIGTAFADLHSDPEALAEALAECRQAPRGQTQRWELCLKCKADDPIWVRAHARLVTDHDENPAILVACDDISGEKKLAAEIQYYATHDPLTELVNRREFERLLGHALESAHERGRRHALCYLDLDNFKIVNDTYGHEAGDELLRQLVARMGERLRQRDVLARLGGDEFALLMENCEQADADRVAHTLIAAIRDHEFIWQGYRLRVGCCAGLVCIDAAAGGIANVMRAADAACYEAKALGPNSVHVHSESDSLIVSRRQEMSWANRLRSALEHDRLLLYAQPIVNCQTPQANVAYEILVRLREGSDIFSPEDFMGPAQRYGLLRDIDTLVLNRTLEFLAANAGNLKPFEWIGVNMSASSMGHPEFLEFAVDALRNAPIDSSCLCFEITETTVIRNLTQAKRFMAALQELGCMFGLDDFGTGLASFDYLRSLPISKVKIDGSFVSDIPSDATGRAMVESIHHICQFTGKISVAECVESAALAAAVAEIGIDFAQGNHYGEPAPLEQVLLADGATASLSNHPARPEDRG